MEDMIEKSSEDTLLKNLKKLREIHGLSQQRFADLFNLSQQSIYKYENDISEPSIETLTKIADYFNTSIDYLVDFTDIPCPLEQRNEETLSPTEKELIDDGLLESFDVITLIAEIEDQFGIEIPAEEIVPENFN